MLRVEVLTPVDAPELLTAIDSSRDAIREYLPLYEELVRDVPSASAAIRAMGTIGNTYGIFDDELTTKILGGIMIGSPRSKNIAHISYWVRSDQTGHGIATRAVGLALEQIPPSINQVFGYVDASNRASSRVLERNGFELQPPTGSMMQQDLVYLLNR